jgi:hypothetical protein
MTGNIMLLLHLFIQYYLEKTEAADQSPTPVTPADACNARSKIDSETSILVFKQKGNGRDIFHEVYCQKLLREAAQ